MGTPVNQPGTSGTNPFVSNVRWMSARGFEYITTMKADNFEDLKTLHEIFETEVLGASGNPLMSSNLRNPLDPLPRADAPETKEIEARDQPGTKIQLPDGDHLFTVKEVFKDAGLNGGEPKFKVVIAEQDYKFAKGKWGIRCFHPEAFYPNWKKWEAGARKAPAEGAEKVIVRDPGDGQNLAEVIEFRSA